jgi:hypothetical protein
MALTFIESLDYHQEKKGDYAPFCDNPKCWLNYPWVKPDAFFIYMAEDQITYTRRVWYKGLDKGNPGKRFNLCNACFNVVAMFTGIDKE